MIKVDEKDNVTCVEGTIRRSGRNERTVYLFLVDGMLIDTGSKNLEKELIPFYEDHSFDLVTLTHSHEDHSGTAPWIQEKRNIPIYVHPKGINICAQKHPYPKYRQMTWGARDEFIASPLGDRIKSRTHEWKIIYTPGHADDHISLFHEETGRLFSGDLFVTPKTKVIMRSESIPVIMNSIRTLLFYDFGTMFCSHTGYIRDGKNMLRQKMNELEYIYGEVESLYREGLSIIEIDKRLFPKKYSIVEVSNGEWDSLHIVSSIVSYIEK
ncbi:MBL fold metallo-hydrolase [Cytobacillus depressus]|uniref:MBL fold metallo-hydrolase n=1 Tax=Cytobacillus depressus TaxID=1602942 RepID=A0A6L3VD69_9BACI|nr:MBL fold metallo-hydrolase [Cytobacillus depressus]KAB2338593.1 MBL fold metallo-hydrolase [Cytobacillus depressus]